MSVEPRPPLTVLIADDEPLARRRIDELLRGRPEFRVVGQCESGTRTVEAVRELSPDVLFLDVQMPTLDGFEVLASLRADERPVVIFSTAYDEYALAAFEVSAVDYLLKPFDDERFDEALRRAQEACDTARIADWRDRLRGLLEQVGTGTHSEQHGAGSPGTSVLDRLAIRRDDRYEVIEAATVDWIEAAGDHVRLHVGRDSHLLRGTMAALERSLDARRFQRIHRSTIVQLSRIREIYADLHGDYVAVLHGGRRLRVSRRYREATLARLGVRR